MATFRTLLKHARGENVCIVVPEEVVLSFDAGKRVPVRVTLHATDDGAAEHSYESTIAVMGGRYLIPVNRAHRTAAGAEVGQERDVTLVHNTTPDEIVVPDDLAAALEDAGLTATFAALARSHRKEHVRAVIEAKRPETRARRIAKSVAMVAQKTRH